MYYCYDKIIKIKKIYSNIVNTSQHCRCDAVTCWSSICRNEIRNCSNLVNIESGFNISEHDSREQPGREANFESNFTGKVFFCTALN